ncbi:MAG: hypothetical protein ACMUJM_04320 [bacterium]
MKIGIDLAKSTIEKYARYSLLTRIHFFYRYCSFWVYGILRGHGSFL